MKQNAWILFHDGLHQSMSAHDAYDAEGRRKYLSRTEGQKFVAEASKLPNDRALFCLTFYYTGCRISEVLNLRREDIDAETDVVMIRSLKKREKHEIRRIPIPNFLSQAVRERANGNELVWNFSRTTAWRIVKSVMQKTGLIGIHATAKGLRHGFGVRAAMEKIPVSLIQNWMGHSDPVTTAIYLSVKDEEERELIKKTW